MEIDIWGNQQMKKHIEAKNYPTWKPSNGNLYFEGFKFVGPRFIELRPAFDKGQCTFETPTVDSFPEDRHIVALDNSDLIGVFSLMQGFYHYEFPHYYPRILEVKKDKQHCGVATALIRRLKEPCFLWGKVFIIRDNSYTADGLRYLKPRFDAEMHGTHFKFVDGTMTRLEDYRLGEI
jgi:hypothetical protein